jgi:hypothetical protein
MKGALSMFKKAIRYFESWEPCHDFDRTLPFCWQIGSLKRYQLKNRRLPGVRRRLRRSATATTIPPVETCTAFRFSDFRPTNRLQYLRNTPTEQLAVRSARGECTSMTLESALDRKIALIIRDLRPMSCFTAIMTPWRYFPLSTLLSHRVQRRCGA